jgi:DNA-binding XRE family transcriptional regulator
MAARRPAPVRYLAAGCNWMDDQVTFDVPADDPMLEPACRAVWEMSAVVRTGRGRRRWTLEKLAGEAGVRRQTIADIEQGRTWPDVATVSRVLAPLGAKATAIRAR